ncbi:head-tail connector protein [Clostridium sporogenes]|uniref:head-tail connector protein n=1 Tax=Clostridium sporogenes TaxID=1509 RepID=UPI0013D71B8B|nr:head-tail connector protein [Clostridium sporogenes]EJO5347031.1 phage gp6-like head-tail connector protein [Clostridium botulinum]MCW6124323.1 head-tail connector protein [Clostridium sporogenes]NFG97921.1 phage gp6-like head-tail connector protein [Clostridium sporogenes]NFH30971.1 phage gp6-like head-tail connector protein [Clostridium sporogenes]NFL18552.1 phage gp6-like head-tail connector protein [Clostridium sporogenes]
MILQEIKDYLKIDNDYEDNSLDELIATSEIYIDSMVGEGYKTDNKALKLANLLQKKLIADMYENRSTEIPTNTKQDRIVTSILDKLSNFEV